MMTGNTNNINSDSETQWFLTLQGWLISPWQWDTVMFDTTGMTHFTLTVRHSDVWHYRDDSFHPDSETQWCLTLQGWLISPWQWDTVQDAWITLQDDSFHPDSETQWFKGRGRRLISLWQWDVKILGQQNGLISPRQWDTVIQGQHDSFHPDSETQWFRGNMTNFTPTVRHSDSGATWLISPRQWDTVIQGQHD